MVTLKDTPRKQRSEGRGERRDGVFFTGKGWASRAWVTSASFHLQNRIKRGWSPVSNLTPLAKLLNIMDCFLNFKL